MFRNLYFYLNRHHHTSAHKQRDARVALVSDFKVKYSQQKLFAKCMTEMFALNYVLRGSAGP